MFPGYEEIADYLFCVSMRLTLDFWAAVRLVEFANLSITQRNFRSLWPHMSGPGKTGELWGAYRARVSGYGDPPDLRAAWPRRHTFRQSQAASEAFRLLGANMRMLPQTAWPHVGRNGPIGYRALRAIHERTRQRLVSICNNDFGVVVQELKGYRSPPRRLQASSRDNASPSTRAMTAFVFVEDLDDREPETLGAHVDTLFVRTAVADLWPRFFRCASESCALPFRVMKLKGRTRNFCSDPCRVQRNRRDDRQERHAARTIESERFQARVAILRKEGRDDPWEQACREFGYPPSGPPD